MVSGKYSALTGAITREQSMANISSNLANVSTVGYKKMKMSFESMLVSEKQMVQTKGINYNRVRTNFTDFSQGPTKETGNPYDLAIIGEGFFKTRGNDSDLYTRKGDFRVDSEGRLVTDQGFPVLDNNGAEIFLPNSDTNKIIVDQNGVISSITLDGNKSEIASLGIYTVEDKTNLKQLNNTYFSLEDEQAEVLSDNFAISQGSLEDSNVNMTAEMARMINDNRLFETYHKVLRSYSKIGEKLNDLGTIA